MVTRSLQLLVLTCGCLLIGSVGCSSSGGGGGGGADVDNRSSIDNVNANDNHQSNPNDNAPAPQNDNGGASGGGGGTLTDEQTALVRLLVGKQIRLMEMLGVLSVVAEPGTVPDTDTTIETGTCPPIESERQGTAIGVALRYDVLEPCANAWGTVAGPVNIVIDPATPVFTASYEYSHVNGDFFKGFFASTATMPDLAGTVVPGMVSADLTEWQGLVSLQDTDTSNVVLDVEGGIQVVFDPDADTVTMSSSGLYVLKEEVDKFETTAADIAIDPVHNGSYLPVAGSLTITPYEDNSWYGEFTTLRIEFQADSPETGSFSVSFDGGEPATVTLE